MTQRRHKSGGLPLCTHGMTRLSTPPQELFSNETVHGGSSYGAAHWRGRVPNSPFLFHSLPLALTVNSSSTTTPGAGTLANGDGSRMPSEFELGFAKYQGEYMTNFVAQLMRGKKE